MAHIANCMRPNAEKESVYITEETSALRSAVSALPNHLNPALVSVYAHTEGSELKLVQAEKENKKEKGLSRPTISPQSGSAKYQLWPALDRSPSPVVQSQQASSSEKMLALHATRSPTSLSDIVSVTDPHPAFWHRSGSLSRRRKISVPELGASMATVQEFGVDSPTIPGRPPLRKAASDAVFGHERSSSAPGNSWRLGPFGDALVSCVTGPATLLHELGCQPVPAKPAPELSNPAYGPPLTAVRPLSPILSPPNSSRPVLKVDTSPNIQEESEIKPEVPPKSPSLERKGSPGPKHIGGLVKSSTTTPSGKSPNTLGSAISIEGRKSPNTPMTPATQTHVASPSSAIERGASPVITSKTTGHTRNASDTSIMDRGRPNKKGLRRQRSRTCSEVNNDSQKPDTWKLPKGQLAADASQTYHCTEKEDLHKQALSQAEKFEVLHKRDVNSLSRELRALDERCEYLRKTYKSLREGRQKLHSRMVSYLKRTETQIFSRESLLKQEEALAELDASIDDFLMKLEQAENRRLRLRQKLLEHVAAALILSPTRSPLEGAESTPPRSPVKTEMSPSALDRSESIKVFADRRALDLFADIEQAIGKMCEAC